MGLAVDSVGSGGGQLDGVSLAGSVKEIGVGDGISINAALRKRRKS